MRDRLRVLFVTWPFPGHWHPLVALARAVEAAGHEVAFVSDLATNSQLAALGFTTFRGGLDAIDVTTATLLGLNPHQTFQRGAEAIIPDLLQIGRAWRPSILVRDAVSFGACIAAEILGIPHASVDVEFGQPPEAMQLRIPVWINDTRAAWNLPSVPLEDLDRDLLHRYLSLSGVPRCLQHPSAHLPLTLHAIQPFLFDLSGSERLPGWFATRPALPVVYATMGTDANRKLDNFRLIIEAFRDEPVSLVVTVGRDNDPSQLAPIPENVHVETYVPQSLLMPYCDLVVAHGGYSTILTAASHGIPLLFLRPHRGQQSGSFGSRMNMAYRCVDVGVARVIEAADVSSEDIRADARSIRGDHRYRAQARELQREIDALPRHAHAVELLSRVARSHQPVYAGSLDPSVRI